MGYYDNDFFDLNGDGKVDDGERLIADSDDYYYFFDDENKQYNRDAFKNTKPTASKGKAALIFLGILFVIAFLAEFFPVIAFFLFVGIFIWVLFA